MIAGEKSVAIQASHIFDPFPDLLSWMHAILTGVCECSFRVDEEGAEKEFVAKRRIDGNFLFIIRDPAVEDGEFLRAAVSLRQLIENFYMAIEAFVRSSKYRSDQWAYETLGERFERIFATAGTGQTIQLLAKLNRAELGKALFEAAPSYTVHFPDAPDDSAEVKRAIAYLMDPDNPINSAGLFLTPDAWDLPDEYDDWSVSRKTGYILTLLHEHVNSWHGCKLDELKSAVIERFLASSEKDIDKW